MLRFEYIKKEVIITTLLIADDIRIIKEMSDIKRNSSILGIL